MSKNEKMSKKLKYMFKFWISNKLKTISNFHMSSLDVKFFKKSN